MRQVAALIKIVDQTFGVALRWKGIHQKQTGLDMNEQGTATLFSFGKFDDH